jgi:hypothetical protein
MVWCDDPPEDPVTSIFAGCLANHDHAHRLMTHQKGPITSTFTADWFLREGQGRELLGEWMKKTAVRSQDQRRILQVNSHTFPTNSWIHGITKDRESDRCDLCRTLWIVEDRFRTEKELPEQSLGHIYDIGELRRGSQERQSCRKVSGGCDRME